MHQGFAVFDTRLNLDGVADGDEEEGGGYIAYNNDDDNENGVADWDETAENTAEDDLVEITLIDCLPSGITGFLELKVECDVSGNIKVWSSEHKGAGNLVIEGEGDEHWAIGSVPGSLWVEGSGTGTGQLSLGYSPTETSFSGADIVNVAKGRLNPPIVAGFKRPLTIRHAERYGLRAGACEPEEEFLEEIVMRFNAMQKLL